LHLKYQTDFLSSRVRDAGLCILVAHSFQLIGESGKSRPFMTAERHEAASRMLCASAIAIEYNQYSITEDPSDMTAEMPGAFCHGPYKRRIQLGYGLRLVCDAKFC